MKKQQLELIQNDFQHTQLMKAVLNGRIDKIGKFLGLCGMRDSEGRTALMYAAIMDDVQAIGILIRPINKLRGIRALFEQEPQSELKMKSHCGDTALHYAVKCQSLNAVKMLSPLEYGIRNATNLTALMVAAINDYPQAAEILVKYEAQISFQDKTALMLAVQSFSYNTIPILVAKEGGMFVCSNGRFTTSAVEHYVLSNVQINVLVETSKLLENLNYQSEKWSALMEAAVLGDILMVKYLVNREKGMQDPVTGKTALMRCLEKMIDSIAMLQMLDTFEKEKIVKQIQQLQNVALFLSGVKEETLKQDRFGRSSLMRAVQCQKYGIDVVRALLRTEGEIIDKNGQSCEEYTGFDDNMREMIREELTAQT